MGDPRKSRKKYDTPSHPWQKERILEEKKLMKEYGLKNKREIWKAQTEIRKVRMLARHLLGYRGKDKEQRVSELMSRLHRLGILDEEATLDDVLSLKTSDWLDRRLQTVVFKKGLARTIKQARQFIVHGLIAIDGRKITVPGYIVKRGEEDKIGYYRGTPKAMMETQTVETTPEESRPEESNGGEING